MLPNSSSARTYSILWDEVRTYSGQDRALLTHNTDHEQGFTFRTHDHAWHPTDHEGLALLHRRPRQTPAQFPAPLPVRSVLLLPAHAGMAPPWSPTSTWVLTAPASAGMVPGESSGGGRSSAPRTRKDGPLTEW
ncbi:type I-E CRISPR-associated endoribonuclease Cas2 [Streptomyces sp. NPDC086782]|uniref:type I-E CRISPR-associated endoribonuclease Cas2 n=1 Tax=Streptomyces sp. NPDC086782 TaxID=3365757 RepID=UPI0037F3A884